ncbi:SEC10/PgrA surface exclusion domain-containing protein [uncultured Lacticaseibacillus sp.]|uniref:SEC10/PgrA surface exclusion domain-containing protein n=1 Tax=uncultured Lacticaseibacillus sp. TaxID=2775882 RepID=UPI0025965045|nr:SEC10/PgrA surface exclusion domain-containing protein [uncultured Lacticaseibacillus sp.]
MEKKLNKTTSVALLAAAALGAVVLGNKPATGVYAATNDGYVGTAENSQDVDPSTLTDAQKAAIQQRDDAQSQVDAADAATSTASTAASSAGVAQSTAQTNVDSASAAVSSAAANVTPADGVTQAQKDADVTSAANAVTAASAAVSSARTQQAQKASDVNTAQSKVDAASAALSAAQTSTGNSQKAADVQAAQKAVTDAQAAVDAATSAAQSEAENSNDFYIVSAKNQASLAKSNLGYTQNTLSETPSSLSTNEYNGSISDGETLAYATTTGKISSGTTKSSNIQGLNMRVYGDNQLIGELPVYNDDDVKGLTDMPKPGSTTDSIFSGDTVNGQLTVAQQQEMNTYLIGILNKYRASLGLKPISSTTAVYDATQKRGQTLIPETVAVHDDSITNPIFESAGLEDPAECLSGINAYGTTMLDLMNASADALEGMLNGDADSNWGHRQILLSESWNVADGAFSVVKEAKGWGMVFNGVQTVDNSGSALVNTQMANVPAETTVTSANPAYATAKAAVDAAQKQYDLANTALKAATSSLADHLEATSGYDANVALDNAKAALTKAQNEPDTADNTAAIKSAQTALDAAKAALASAQAESDGNVAAAQSALTAAQAALTKAQNEKVAATTSPSQQALADAQAALTRAKTALASATNNANKAQNAVTAAKQQAATAAAALSQALAALDAANKSASKPIDATGTTTTETSSTDNQPDTDNHNNDGSKANQTSTGHKSGASTIQTTDTTTNSTPKASDTTKKPGSNQSTTIPLSHNGDTKQTTVKLGAVRSTQTLAATTVTTKSAASTPANSTKAYPQTGDNQDVVAAELGVMTVIGTLFGIAGVSRRRRN